MFQIVCPFLKTNLGNFEYLTLASPKFCKMEVLHPKIRKGLFRFESLYHFCLFDFSLLLLLTTHILHVSAIFRINRTHYFIFLFTFRRECGPISMEEALVPRPPLPPPCRDGVEGPRVKSWGPGHLQPHCQGHLKVI